MGILDKYARKHKSTDPRTETVSTKLTKEEYKRYLAYLEERGLTVSEGTRYLILEEINQGNEEETKKGISEYTAIDTQLLISSTIDRPRPKPKPKANSGTFTTKKWQLNGKIACPLCRDWTSTTNFRRHVEKHHNGMPTKEIFNDPERIKIADEMVRKEKEKAGLL